MAITAETVKQLRDMTGLGMMKCKEALEATQGDLEKAVEYLRKLGLKTAEKRAGRETSEGVIASYIHSNSKIGVLLELKCESDFVARNDDFRQLARDLCMQVAATRPIAVSRDQVPPAVIEKEREIYREQVKDKPPQAVEKIVAGKLDAFFKEHCLLDQPFVKDPKHTVADLLNALIAKLGENIAVNRFVRLQLGE
ncbi:MAG TPA: translation elongation factor Ts [Planctomycetota bacterium]|nr:translation elongation factor Ts [Planctomycetota bacterium]HRR81658.1 translation elongation factor Ts [Planctomycetota bacterium]HRT95402.1 translation elongation factor Ts [Planctomycetota bacterium]